MTVCPRQLPEHVDHLVAVNEVHIEVALGVADVGAELKWWRSDWELRGHSRQRTIPDALFAVCWPDLDTHVFAVEVEQSTRAPGSFQRKLLHYSAARYRTDGIYGCNDPVVLIVSASTTRLARYRAAILSLALPLRMGFATLKEIEEHGAVDAVWLGVRGDERLSLRQLVYCCNRKDSFATESGEESTCTAAATRTITPMRMR